MRVVLLAHPNVQGYYTASLLERGYKTVTTNGGGAPILQFPHVMKDYLEHDGCLLLGNDPDFVEIADNFELMGKPVWRNLAEVPRAVD